MLNLLSLACGVLLGLPPGWCCVASGGQCCGREPLLVTDTPTPTNRSGCTVCAGRCVCPPRAKQPPAPAKAPEQQQSPCQYACCESAPAAAPKVDSSLFDLGTAALEAPFTLVPVAPADSVRVSVPPRSSFPPLHVLHCVWLC